MSDRAPVTVLLAAVPDEHREAVAAVLAERHLRPEHRDNWRDNEPVRVEEIEAGGSYMDDDVCLGYDADIASELADLEGVCARVSQDAKYEFDGTTHYVVPGLGLWSTTGSQYGEPLLDVRDVDKLVDEMVARSGGWFVRSNDMASRFAELTARAHREQFDAAWKQATEQPDTAKGAEPCVSS